MHQCEDVVYICYGEQLHFLLRRSASMTTPSSLRFGTRLDRSDITALHLCTIAEHKRPLLSTILQVRYCVPTADFD